VAILRLLRGFVLLLLLLHFDALRVSGRVGYGAPTLQGRGHVGDGDDRALHPKRRNAYNTRRNHPLLER